MYMMQWRRNEITCHKSISTPPPKRPCSPIWCQSEGLVATLLQEKESLKQAELCQIQRRDMNRLKKRCLQLCSHWYTFHLYTYGRETEVSIDHKTLKAIVKKSLVKTSKWLQGLLLHIQKYDISVMYVKRKHVHQWHATTILSDRWEELPDRI